MTLNGQANDLHRPVESTRPGALRRALGIAWMEGKMLSRSPLYRVCLVVCWGLGMLLVHAALIGPPHAMVALMDPSELAAEAIELQIMVFAPPMIAFLAASSGARERRPGIAETLFTTPPTSEEFVLGKFLAVVLCTLVLLAGTALSGWIWLRYVEQLPARFLPFFSMAVGWWKPLIYVACLGYAAGLVLPGAGGGVLVVFYLIAMLLAQVLISPVFYPFFRYLSNGYLLLGLSVVFLSAVVYQKERRGIHREQSGPITAAGVLLLIGGVVAMLLAVRSYQTPPFHIDPELAIEAGEHAEPGKPIPAFRVVDQRGEVITPESLRGRPAVLLLLSGIPAPLATLPPSRALAAGNLQSGARRAQIVLVFYTPDPAQGVRWGKAVDASLPVVCQPESLLKPISGLAAMFGLDHRRIRLGYMAVIDSRGEFLGLRPIYDVLRPPAIVSLFGGSGGDYTPEETFHSEVQAAIAFFRALADEDQHSRSM